MSRAAGASGATPLARLLAARIAAEGPIGVDAYMQACLQHPVHGYYRKHAAIGAGGDFVTAPEISQVFGELIGLWCAIVWQQMGRPGNVRIVELGPGRGTLMADALRAARRVPAFHSAASVELVEINPTLIAAQRACLTDAAVPIRWSDDLRPSSAPSIVIANEFLDTLAVAQWVFRDGRWRTRGVGLDASGELAFVEDCSSDEPSLSPPPNIATCSDGDIFETRAAAFAHWTAKLAALGVPTAALFIDYGHGQPALGDTLQAVHGHRYDDPLRAPGESDLTAQVDFAAFAAAARDRGFYCDGPLAQGEFLGRLGIVERASRLMAANPAKALEIESGALRLMSPGGMGSRFYALGVSSKGLAPLPGFDRVDSRVGAP